MGRTDYLWNDLTILWNDLTIDRNDLTWNDLTMERNDRKSLSSADVVDRRGRERSREIV